MIAQAAWEAGAGAEAPAYRWRPAPGMQAPVALKTVRSIGPHEGARQVEKPEASAGAKAFG